MQSSGCELRGIIRVCEGSTFVCMLKRLGGGLDLCDKLTEQVGIVITFRQSPVRTWPDYCLSCLRVIAISVAHIYIDTSTHTYVHCVRETLLCFKVSLKPITLSSF
jgi:hypothetical protein